ncbi:MAG: 3-keto-disaccharide hydrolase [Verrucomicrobiia bacterium]
MKRIKIAIGVVAASIILMRIQAADVANPPQQAIQQTNEPKFFLWLRGLGADSNKVEQLKNQINVDEIRQWLDEIAPPKQEAGKLFNGKDLSGFFIWIEKFGTQVDPDGVFSVTSDGLLRISGQHRGFISTMQVFTNYHLIAEYKWGTKMWGKASDKPRNSGIVVNSTGENKVWSKGIEIQIADGQTGDIVVLDGARITSAEGVTHSKPWSTFYRDDPKERQPVPGWRSKNDPERPAGEWNKVDVFCKNGELTVLINDKKVFAGKNAYPPYGRIYLQSNGSEIFFKNLEIKPLDE